MPSKTSDPADLSIEAEADTAAWSQVRRAPRPGDNGLLGPTRQWLRRLPPRRRPSLLVTRYPRIANRIAWCWPDPVLSTQVLEDLLVDRRGGRGGFALPIVRELQRLRRLNSQRQVPVR